MSKSNTVLLVANGDLRQSANEICWPAQVAMEKEISSAVARFGHRLVRAHPYKPKVRNGFISSQKEGLEVFAKIDRNTPIIPISPKCVTARSSDPPTLMSLNGSA